MRKYNRNFKNVFQPVGYHLVTFFLIFYQVIQILRFYFYDDIITQIIFTKILIFCAFLFYINGIIIKKYIFTYFIYETELNNFSHLFGCKYN